MCVCIDNKIGKYWITRLLKPNRVVCNEVPKVQHIPDYKIIKNNFSLAGSTNILLHWVLNKSYIHKGQSNNFQQ